ncbi:hypothetical protein HMPREF9336_01440 [Segniliparus rugosus ATCC BAA-974]|uniref:HTH tetR-type domain-containing protein n=2 Tax=Segniliparus rugosus TaxID=286804 RepID=E5XPL8_SEGRC|nr:hypothetical protein HMPREF9336_01440 [Segniliparus rugosus ATCC BAA-974]
MEKIVKAGFEVLDEVGLDGLTVRAVAAKLGVKAPSLYWHVRDKQQLLDEMATQMWRLLWAQLGGLETDTLVRDGFRIYANALRRTMLAHRDGARVFAGTYLTDAEVLRAQQAPLASFADRGYEVAVVARALWLVYCFTVGFCVEEQAVSQAPDDRYSLKARDERIGEGAELVRRTGPEILGTGAPGDSDRRFAELIDALADTADRMLGRAGRSAGR